MPKTIVSLLSPKQPASKQLQQPTPKQQNASLSLHRPVLYLGNQAFNALPAPPLQSSLRLHGTREQHRLALLQGPLLLRLRRQVPERVRVRPFHVQHEQARTLPGRLLHLLLLHRPEAFQWAVGVCLEVLHRARHLPSKTSQGSGVPGSSTIGYPEPVNQPRHLLGTLYLSVNHAMKTKGRSISHIIYCALPKFFFAASKPICRCVHPYCQLKIAHFILPSICYTYFCVDINMPFLGV